MLEHRKLRIDSRKWLLAKLAPKKYGDKLDLKLRTARSTRGGGSMTACHSFCPPVASLAINPGLGESQSGTARKGS